MYISVVRNIVIAKVRIVVNAQLVIQISPGKVEVEIRLIEIKYSIVIGKVNLLIGVIHPNCAVPKGRI